MTKLERVIHDTLSEEWCGNHDRPPGSTQKLYVLEREPTKAEVISAERAHGEENLRGVVYVFAGLNDGFEVGIGFRSEWLAMLGRPAALRLAWFILWTWWAKGTWFGLKRVIWYATLRRLVASWKPKR